MLMSGSDGGVGVLGDGGVVGVVGVVVVEPPPPGAPPPGVVLPGGVPVYGDAPAFLGSGSGGSGRPSGGLVPASQMPPGAVRSVSPSRVLASVEPSGPKPVVELTCARIVSHVMPSMARRNGP